MSQSPRVILFQTLDEFQWFFFFNQLFERLFEVLWVTWAHCSVVTWSDKLCSAVGMKPVIIFAVKFASYFLDWRLYKLQQPNKSSLQESKAEEKVTGMLKKGHILMQLIIVQVKLKLPAVYDCVQNVVKTCSELLFWWKFHNWLHVICVLWLNHKILIPCSLRNLLLFVSEQIALFISSDLYL